MDITALVVFAAALQVADDAFLPALEGLAALGVIAGALAIFLPPAPWKPDPRR